jgi:hypothetical protein
MQERSMAMRLRQCPSRTDFRKLIKNHRNGNPRPRDNRFSVAHQGIDLYRTTLHCHKLLSCAHLPRVGIRIASKTER